MGTGFSEGSVDSSCCWLQLFIFVCAVCSDNSVTNLQCTLVKCRASVWNRTVIVVEAVLKSEDMSVLRSDIVERSQLHTLNKENLSCNQYLELSAVWIDFWIPQGFVIIFFLHHVKVYNGCLYQVRFCFRLEGFVKASIDFSHGLCFSLQSRQWLRLNWAFASSIE